jgi:hypothetical protein
MSIALSVLFGLFVVNSWGQVLLNIAGHSNDPGALTALQLGSGATALATSWGAWHRTRWAAGAAVLYGLATAGLVAALPRLLDLPAAARSGLWLGSTAILVFSLLCAAYLRSDARRVPGQITPERASER